jgi:hypothetical protein
MTIVQLITVEDGCIQGLGKDGKLYKLVYVGATFGRADKQWVLDEGCPSLAETVAIRLRYARLEDIGRRVKSFAESINAKASNEQNAVIEATRYTIALGSEHVYVIAKPECIIVAGSDGSRAQLDLVGSQYV